MLICSARGHLSAGVSSLSWALPASACPRGDCRILGCVPNALCSGACAVVFALLPRSPLRGAAARAPPSCSGSHRAHCSPIGSLAAGCGALSPGRRRLLVPQGAPGHPRSSWGPAPTPGEGLSSQEDWCSSCFSRRGSPVLGTLAPALAWLLAGLLPLDAFCFFISFFPSSYLDRSVNSSHSSIPGVPSLNLKPNS